MAIIATFTAAETFSHLERQLQNYAVLSIAT